MKEKYLKDNKNTNLSSRTIFFLLKYQSVQYLCSKVNDLHCTDDGESRQQSHGSSNSRQHINKLGCSVLGDHIKSWSIDVNSYISQLVNPPEF